MLLIFVCKYFLANNLQLTVDLPCLVPVFGIFDLNLWQLHFAYIMHANFAFLMYANNSEFMRLTPDITP